MCWCDGSGVGRSHVCQQKNIKEKKGGRMIRRMGILGKGYLSKVIICLLYDWDCLD